MLADAGSSVSISPDVELKMGFGMPMTGRVLAAGAPAPAAHLEVDWVHVGARRRGARTR